MDHSEILGTYKGHKVTSTKIVVKSIGDGLSNPVAVSPIVIEPGQTAFLAVRVTTSKHRYEFEKAEDGTITGCTLVQEFLCTGAAFADSKLVGAAIQKVVDANAEAEALKKNQLTLDITDAEVTDITDARAKKGAK